MYGDCVGGSSIGVQVEGDECDVCIYRSKIHAVYKAEHESPETYGFELNN